MTYPVTDQKYVRHVWKLTASVDTARGAFAIEGQFTGHGIAHALDRTTAELTQKLLDRTDYDDLSGITLHLTRKV